MTDSAKTIAAVLVAAALAGALWLTRATPMRDAFFSDQGELIAPEFTDPLAAASLEIVSFDEDSGAWRPFKVHFDGARWVIPSHHNYPADASEKMAEAAAALIGLRKEQIITDQSAEHQALGVLDPDDDAAPLSGRGTRITIHDQNSRVLTSVILGKEAPSASPDEPVSDRRYIRISGRNRVYATTLDKALSTRFADWVETDLLQLAAPGAGPAVGIDKIALDNYSIDESTGRRTDVESLVLRQVEAPADPAQPGAIPTRTWTFDAEPGGPPQEGEASNTARIQEIADAVKNLQIVGVRPKPANLAAMLSGVDQRASLNQADIMSLQSRGFYISQSGQLLANDGQLSVFTSDGVVYTLWFGEVLFGAGDAISAGVDAAPQTDAAEESAPAAPAAPVENRYMFVTVSFDPALIPEPAPPPAPEPAPDSAEESASDAEIDPSGAPPQTPAADPVSTAAEMLYQRQVSEREAKLTSGRRRAESLGKRFADWYYVIDASSFAKLRATRADLIAAPAPEPAPVTTDDAAPAP